MYYRSSHDVVTLRCKSRATFRLLFCWYSSGDEVDWLRIYITLAGCEWCILILTVPARSCSLSGPYHSPVIFLDRGHPRFRNFNSAIPVGPVDVVRVKSYADGFLDPRSVPVRVSINNFLPRSIADNGRSCGRTQKGQTSAVSYSR